MKRFLVLICGAAVVVAAAALVSADAAPTTPSAVPAGLVGASGKTITTATWQKNHVYVEPPGHFAIVITKGGVTRIFLPPG